MVTTELQTPNTELNLGLIERNENTLLTGAILGVIDLEHNRLPGRNAFQRTLKLIVGLD